MREAASTSWACSSNYYYFIIKTDFAIKGETILRWRRRLKPHLLTLLQSLQSNAATRGKATVTAHEHTCFSATRFAGAAFVVIADISRTASATKPTHC